MTRGGSRNRSGPQADPDSGRSDRRGYKMTALPADGYDGDVPDFPLPKREIMKKVAEGDITIYEFDAAATKAVAERESSLWAWAWTMPQACAWSMPSEAWRLHTIAMWVRTFVICEGSDATAADKNSLHRFADQIGMSPAGLKENGWAIVADEVGPRSRQSDTGPQEDAPKRERRLRAAQ